MPNKTTTQFSARKRLIVVAISACFTSAPAWSNPTVPQVVNGTASFNQAGNLLTVSNSNGAIINWNTFSIGANETTRFNQGSAASSVLNRVLANDPSVLLGTLSSNGRVWLVNPAGIMVGQGARIDVAGFIASTLNVRNEDFLANRLNFQATPNAGGIQNYGQITTPSGGSVYLVAPAVENHGIINAPNGEVILAAGQTVQLIDTGTPGVKVDITGAEGKVTNLGEIVSEAGRIGMAGVLVKNSGTLNASSLVKEGGRIFLKASQDAYVDGAGRIVATGTKGGSIEVLGNNVIMAEQAVIDASGDQQGGGNILLKADMSSGTATVAGSLLAKGGAQGGDGGFIETSGAHVKIADSARVNTLAPNGKAGTWLIDPADYTIAASGGDITGSTLGSNLNVGNVTILSSQGTVNPSGSGDIFVNDTVGWTAATTLRLNADRNVNVNAPVSNFTGGSLVLRADNAGTGTGTVIFGGGGGVALSGGGRADVYYNPVSYTDTATKSDTLTNPYSSNILGPYTAWMLVNNVGAYGGAGGLQGMTTNLGGNYALGKNIDASATSLISWDGGAGFVPVGPAAYGSEFIGKFDGLNHTITALTINRPGTSQIGLFGFTSGATIRNVGMVGGSLSGNSDVGGLVGANSSSPITNSYNTGTVNGSASYGSNVGGLVGFNSSSTITNSYSTGAVNGNTVSGSRVGGLVGYNSSSTISNSYSTGNVASGSASYGGSYVGGLVGYNSFGTISNSYSTGNVTAIGGFAVGGLLGNNSYFTPTADTILNSYSTGSVTGSSSVGGLVGATSYGGITNTYSTGSVSGSVSYGGLVGANSFATVTSSYWDATTSGQATSGGGVGKTTAEMQQLATFSGWSIADTGGSSAIWRIYDDNPNLSSRSYPLLRSFLTPVTGTANSGSRTYDGTADGIGVSFPGTTDLSKVLGTPTYTGASRNVGSYPTITPGGLYSVQQGYDISYASGALTVTQAPLTVSAVSNTRSYDGTTGAAATPTITSGTLFAPDTAVFAETYTDRNAGTGKTLTPTAAITDGNAGANYAVTLVNNTAGVITPAALTVSAQSDTRVYNGTTSSSVAPILAGTLFGDAVGTAAIQTYDTRNAGTGKTLTASGLVVNDGNSGNNYSISYVPTATGVIAPALLTVSAATNTRSYNATTSAAATPTITSGTLFSGDSAVLAETYADKNVGTGKALTPTAAITDGNAGANYAVTLVSNTTGVITPASITLSGISANSKVYDGNAAATLNTGSALTNGVFAPDAITLSGTVAASFANRNAGTGKIVTASGFSLGGADAGNYVLIQPTGLSANITQLASVAWTASVSGNWSLASNWASNALPDGSNVLAVTIPSGLTVTYDPATANTTLNTLTSSGALTLAGGTGSNLTVNSQLTTPQFTMTSGSLTGAGGLTVSSSYSQSGGTIALTGTATANITQATGNLLVGSLAAPTVRLTAQAGAISQSAPIVASNLITQSVTGTNLPGPGNQVSGFTATNSGSGNVALTNTGTLSITSISDTNGNITIDNTGQVTTTGAVSAPAGTVSIVAHSPLTIGTGGVSSGGNIILTAGGTTAATDNLTLDGVIQTTGSGSSITLFADDNLFQNKNVTTNGGPVSAIAQNGSITMAPGATTSTGGGSVGYTSSTGSTALSSLNATSGAITLTAGGNITAATGFSGTNLTGGTATIVAGGSVNLTTNVPSLNTTGVHGTFSLIDPSTGTVLTNVPVVPPSTTTAAQDNTSQLLNSITAATQPPQTTTATLPPMTTVVTTSGSTLLTDSTQTTGGTTDSFGGTGSSDKPADDKSAKKDDDKKKGEGTAAKKDEGKPAAKKLATCS